MRLTGVHADQWKSATRQLAMQPIRHPSGLQHDTLQTAAQIGKRCANRFRFRRRLAFAFHGAVGASDADSRRVFRDIRADIVLCFMSTLLFDLPIEPSESVGIIYFE